VKIREGLVNCCYFSLSLKGRGLKPARAACPTLRRDCPFWALTARVARATARGDGGIE